MTCPRPHCGGLVDERLVVTTEGKILEVYCVLCSRIFWSKVLTIYDPVPPVIDVKTGKPIGEHKDPPVSQDEEEECPDAQSMPGWKRGHGPGWDPYD